MDNKYKKPLALASAFLLVGAMVGCERDEKPKDDNEAPIICEFASNADTGTQTPICEYVADVDSPALEDIALDLTSTWYHDIPDRHSTVSIEEDGVQVTLAAVSSEESNSKWPNVSFQNWDPRWNWTNAGAISFEVVNPGSESLNLFVRIADEAGVSGAADHQVDKPFTVAPGTSQLEIRFNGDNQGIEGDRVGTNLDWASVIELQFYTAGPVAEQTFILGDVTFLDKDESQKELACAIQNVQEIPTLAMIEDFSVDKSLIFREGGSTATLIDVDGNQALQIDYAAAPTGYPNVMFQPAAPWDWSEFGNVALALDIANPGASSVQLFLRVDDAENEDFGGTANGVVDSRNGIIQVPGESESTTYYFSLAELAASLNPGMRGTPVKGNYNGKPASFGWGEDLTADAIWSFQLYQIQPSDDSTLILDNIRVVEDVSADTSRFVGILDEFGQYTAEQWSNKISSVEELECTGTADLQLIELAEQLEGRSQYGGYAVEGSPKYAGTGYFTTVKHEGKWMLVDPEGYLYWATGLDNMRMNDQFTTTGTVFTNLELDPDAPFNPSDVDNDGYASSTEPRSIGSELRDSMFTWLPEYSDELAQNYGYTTAVHTGPLEHGEVFSFYGANLMRKFQEDSIDDAMEAWTDVTLARMWDWGFTSLGNWSDDELLYQNGKVPYTAHGWITGSHKRISTGNDYWAPMHDPYDSEFRVSVKSMVADIDAKTQDDPYMIGIFVENELSWGNLASAANHYAIATATLAMDATESPAKARFVEMLQLKYSNDIAALNTAWSTDFADWAEIEGEITAPAADSTVDVTADYSAYLEDQAGEFFKVIKEELKAAMPNHLYLGSRFSDWGLTPEAENGAAAHVDVMSYNNYAENLNSLIDFTHLEEIDLPAIIGEFHFGSLDTGMFSPGLVAADDQAHRAEKFVTYMESVLEHPSFVGAHWFQYLDSPTTGRAWDGENYNNGFVSVTDVPYTDIVNAAKAFNESLYEMRLTPAP